MADVLNLYLDDSGTRNPDRNPADALPDHGHDWFGIGGVMIREGDEEAFRTEHAALYTKWKPFGMEKPLHSAEIRSQNKGFRWIRRCSREQLAEFYDDIGRLATHPQLTAIACVIDRSGYNQRYLAKYGDRRWLLCKTAFSIAVERSVKYAQKLGCRLRVNVERSDKTVDALLLSYYNELRGKGPPFDGDTSAKYSPLAAQMFAETLYEFQTKNKSSPPMQIADICLWPMCIGGYKPDNKSYVALRAARSLVDCKLLPEEIPTCGIKYSCWELQDPIERAIRESSGMTLTRQRWHGACGREVTEIRAHSGAGSTGISAGIEMSAPKRTVTLGHSPRGHPTVAVQDPANAGF